MRVAADSPAQIYIQAADYLRRFGAFPPWEVSSPLLPSLIAGLTALTGLSAEAAYVLLAAAAYVAGCVALYLLVRRFQPQASVAQARVALAAAALYAVAPSRLFAVFAAPDGSRLLFWSLFLFLLLVVDRFRRRPQWLNLWPVLALALAWAASAPLRFHGHDGLAALEIMALLGVSLAARRQVVARGQAACLVAFAMLAGWKLWIEPQTKLEPLPMPAGVLAWIEQQLPGARAFGPPSLDVLMNPALSQAGRVIAAREQRPEESLLWLRAMAAQYVVSADWRKFHSALECVYEEAGWCVYHLPESNPAKAVLVSRHRWQSLRAIRGLFDVEGLEAYLGWAERPESAGVRWLDTRSLEVHANLGAYDLLLVRLDRTPGWRAALLDEDGGRKEIAIERDPLGFMVLDPARTGDVRVLLEFKPSWMARVLPASMAAVNLPGGDFPAINPDGVGDAVHYSPPPFKPGDLLTIFGRNFVPEQTQVFFDEQPGEVLWVSPQQINVRLPAETKVGEIEVVVESAGRRSYPEIIEVAG